MSVMSRGIQELKGTRALVTGASRGIGVYIARTLAERGAELVLVARDAEKLGAVARECEARGVRVTVLAADVGASGDRQRVAEGAGAVDVLVNNAGLERAVRVTDLAEGEAPTTVAVNLVAPIELTRLLLPGMLQRGRGVIVNVSSMAGKSPTPFNSVYSATKYGLNGFTGALNFELEGTGVHAGAVCPSFVAEAGMWKDAGGKAPPMLKEIPPERVVDGVLAVIRGSREELVTPTPMRPLLALSQLFPAVEPGLMRRLGVVRAFRERADGERSRR